MVWAPQTGRDRATTRSSSATRSTARSPRPRPASATSRNVKGPDIYETHDGHPRGLHASARTVRSGNSGGPLIDPTGQLLGVIFAAALDDPDTGFAAHRRRGAAGRRRQRATSPTLSAPAPAPEFLALAPLARARAPWCVAFPPRFAPSSLRSSVQATRARAGRGPGPGAGHGRGGVAFAAFAATPGHNFGEVVVLGALVEGGELDEAGAVLAGDQPAAAGRLGSRADGADQGALVPVAGHHEAGRCRARAAAAGPARTWPARHRRPVGSAPGAGRRRGPGTGTPAAAATGSAGPVATRS